MKPGRTRAVRRLSLLGEQGADVSQSTSAEMAVLYISVDQMPFLASTLDNTDQELIKNKIQLVVDQDPGSDSLWADNRNDNRLTEISWVQIQNRPSWLQPLNRGV